MRRIEALADAILAYNGYKDVSSPLYSARNPGGLMAFSMKQAQDGKGLRVFNSFIDGYQALLFDLQLKCAGKSRAKLKPESALTDLICSYGYKDTMADFVVRYCRRALNDESLGRQVPISYFLEDDNNA